MQPLTQTGAQTWFPPLPQTNSGGPPQGNPGGIDFSWGAGPKTGGTGYDHIVDPSPISPSRGVRWLGPDKGRGY